MQGYELHDTETEENLGSVVIIKRQTAKAEKIISSEEALTEGWEHFNKLEETEGDHTDVDGFVEWFNTQYVTQIDRLYLEFIQPD